VPNYYTTITKPMWFSKIRSKIEADEYNNLEEFKSDVLQVFTNCMTFNPKGTEYYKLAAHMKKYKFVVFLFAALSHSFLSRFVSCFSPCLATNQRNSRAIFQRAAAEIDPSTCAFLFLLPLSDTSSHPHSDPILSSLSFLFLFLSRFFVCSQTLQFLLYNFLLIALWFFSLLFFLVIALVLVLCASVITSSSSTSSSSSSAFDDEDYTASPQVCLCLSMSVSLFCCLC
jgi:hypothetical protein